MCMSFCTLSTAVIAAPSEELSARLNDTVMAGNCPWWVMASGSVVFSKCAKALSGTALLVAELVALAVLGVALDAFVSAFAGAARVFADGVYSAEVDTALEPAEDDPEAAKDEEAPAPLEPEDALDWI